MRKTTVPPAAGGTMAAAHRAGLPGHALTQRETAVLLLLAQLHGKAEIAVELGVPTRVVERHVATLLRKLAAAKIAQPTLIRPDLAHAGRMAPAAHAAHSPTDATKLSCLAERRRARLRSRAAQQCACAATRVAESQRLLSDSATLLARLKAERAANLALT